jgi:hypothetical protein
MQTFVFSTALAVVAAEDDCFPTSVGILHHPSRVN